MVIKKTTMATTKSYTDIEQSKKLAEILPLESADMSYSIIHNIGQEPYHCNIPTFTHATHDDIPCWSLAALLKVIKEKIGYTLYGVAYSLDVYMSCSLGDKPWKLETNVYDNEVDACVEMILKLHEHNLL